MLDILGVDWGEKRFGLAFADSSSQLVLAANYECLAENIWQILDREIHSRKIQIIVVGRPVNFQGRETMVTNLVDNFISELKQKYLNLQIREINERGSSQNFQARGVDKQQLNHLAAARILEYYFGIENG
jgi:putative Holliday junction resolvase